MRIGIDVGGTHTDAVILDGDKLLSATKQLTTEDVLTGVTAALDEVLKDAAINSLAVQSVMIGTTQFTNAIVERRELAPVGIIRIGLPSGRGLPPMLDWPADIREAIGGEAHQIHGGFLYDGAVLAELDDAEIDTLIARFANAGLTNFAIASAFSPMNASPEAYVAQKLSAALPGARITQSNRFGRLGLLERENASILNATLLPFADKVVSSFLGAISARGLQCPVYISQNDGTLMSADFVREFPALTFASGPTNSLRGAYKLTGLEDAIVIDIGGTTSDIGVLQSGFPRQSNTVIEVGGVRTNFRMPDILAVGLGGGSIVSSDGNTIGPKSVGHKLVNEGLVFGGNTLTATDILVASEGTQIGDPVKVAGLSHDTVEAATHQIHAMLNQNTEMMKPGSQSMPVILVGGGAVLVTKPLAAASEIHRPTNAGVANAIGAAIAQVGGETEKLVSYRNAPRDEAISEVTRQATDRAIAAGASPPTIRTVDIEETAIPYMDEGATRIRVKVIGELAI